MAWLLLLWLPDRFFHRHLRNVTMMVALCILRDLAASFRAGRALSLSDCGQRPSTAGEMHKRIRRGIVTLTSDGQAGAEDGYLARVKGRTGHTFPAARQERCRTGSRDRRQLLGDVVVDESAHGRTRERRGSAVPGGAI